MTTDLEIGPFQGGAVDACVTPLAPERLDVRQATGDSSALRGRIAVVCAGRSNRELAQLLRMNRETVRRYRTGASPPSAVFVARLCAAMAVSPEWMLMGKEEGETGAE